MLRKRLIRLLLLMFLLIAIVFVIDTKQWELVKKMLTSFIPYENGGLPTGG